MLKITVVRNHFDYKALRLSFPDTAKSCQFIEELVVKPALKKNWLVWIIDPNGNLLYDSSTGDYTLWCHYCDSRSD